MEHLLTVENLQKFDLKEYDATEIEGYYRHKSGSYNALSFYQPPDIDSMRSLVKANQVIEPLHWLTRFENVVNVSYEKYLELMECKAVNNNNHQMLRTIEEYKKHIT